MTLTVNRADVRRLIIWIHPTVLKVFLGTSHYLSAGGKVNNGKKNPKIFCQPYSEDKQFSLASPLNFRYFRPPPYFHQNIHIAQTKTFTGPPLKPKYFWPSPHIDAASTLINNDWSLTEYFLVRYHFVQSGSTLVGGGSIKSGALVRFGRIILNI